MLSREKFRFSGASNMLRYLLFILTVSAFNPPLFAQAKEYKLVSKMDNADLNRRAILSIDKTRSGAARRSAFQPVKGNFTVYVFIATFRGRSFDNSEKDFHDILVVKANRSQKVLAAYQYTLEWAEMPFSQDLYKSGAKRFTLASGCSIEKFRFRKVGHRAGVESDLKEHGVLLF